MSKLVFHIEVLEIISGIDVGTGVIGVKTHIDVGLLSLDQGDHGEIAQELELRFVEQLDYACSSPTKMRDSYRINYNLLSH